MYRVFTTSEANLVKAFSDLKGEIQVHLEAGELAPWAASVIAPLVSPVVCSHPQSNAWIARDADLAVQEISVLDFVFHTDLFGATHPSSLLFQPCKVPTNLERLVGPRGSFS